MSCRPTRRALPLLAAVLVPVLFLAGCGGSGTSEEKTPAEVMATAKKNLDEASSVRIALSTTSVPTSGNGVLGATGDLTGAPAFEGEVKVLLSGLTATVPVTSVDGKVYAKLPLATKYAVIDPAEYGAPDPADFADPQKGLSSLLTSIEGLEEGDSLREGEQILSTYTGTLPGSSVKTIIPSAAAQESYETRVGVDESGRVGTVRITGPFFADGDDVTYDVTFDNYDEGVEITPPSA